MFWCAFCPQDHQFIRDDPPHRDHRSDLRLSSSERAPAHNYKKPWALRHNQVGFTGEEKEWHHPCSHPPPLLLYSFFFLSSLCFNTLRSFLSVVFASFFPVLTRSLSGGKTKSIFSLFTSVVKANMIQSIASLHSSHESLVLLSTIS